MDWIRRNWPDLLIGIALVAVIAGIIATLLTGGSFFPFGQSESSGSRQQPSSSSPPSLAGAAEAGSARSGTRTPEAANGSSTREANGGIGGVEVTALPLPGASRSGAANDAGASAAGTQRSDAGSGDASTSVAPVDGASSTSPTSTTRSVAETRTAPSPASTTSSPAPAADDDGLYRVSVGAFTSSDNAARQADIFREAGYPVFIGTQGNLSIVLVGPYDQRSEAERAAEKIRAGDFRIEPVIYRFRSESSPTSTSSSAAGATSSNTSESSNASQSSSSSATTPAPQPSASEAGGARYLQVGAYATAESARPQRDRLEGLGFRVTERTEGSLIKLLVGPFAGDDLSAARSRLNEQGIDHFPR